MLLVGALNSYYCLSETFARVFWTESLNHYRFKRTTAASKHTARLRCYISSHRKNSSLVACSPATIFAGSCVLQPGS